MSEYETIESGEGDYDVVDEDAATTPQTGDGDQADLFQGRLDEPAPGSAETVGAASPDYDEAHPAPEPDPEPEPEPDPDPIGACCIGDGVCVDGMTEANCVAASGSWLGEGLICNDYVCRARPPDEGIAEIPLGDCSTITAEVYHSPYYDMDMPGGLQVTINPIPDQPELAGTFTLHSQWPTTAAWWSGFHEAPGYAYPEYAVVVYASMGGNREHPYMVIAWGLVRKDDYGNYCAAGDRNWGSNQDDLPKDDFPYDFELTQYPDTIFENYALDPAIVIACPPIGACCFDDGTCSELDDEDCVAAGGTYQGDDTVCDPNPCPQPTGACCMPDGSCSVLTEAACSIAGGNYQGDDEVCDPNPCPQPTGACCFDDGTCSVLTDAACTLAGGTYQGDDTVCSPNPCPQPTGACCFDDGTCSVLTEAACALAGGAYEGDDEVCSPNPCPSPGAICNDCSVHTSGTSPCDYKVTFAGVDPACTFWAFVEGVWTFHQIIPACEWSDTTMGQVGPTVYSRVIHDGTSIEVRISKQAGWPPSWKYLSYKLTGLTTPRSGIGTWVLPFVSDSYGCGVDLSASTVTVELI